MAIKYDKNLNDKIRRTVKNFNAKVRYNRTKTRGKGMLPRTISTQALKDKYSDKSRAELEKQLKLYQSFGQRDALNRAGNSRISEWELNYFKSNLDKTKQFFEDEISDLQRVIGDKPQYHMRLHERVNDLTRQRAYLNKDLETLSEDEIKTMRNVFSYAERSDIVKEQSFRLYLSQLERVMDNLGYPKQDINNLLNKFNVLSENEFTEMMRNEDLVDVVYNLIDSPKQRGEFELMTDENRARSIVSMIEEQADTLIAKYKTK